MKKIISTFLLILSFNLSFLYSQRLDSIIIKYFSLNLINNEVKDGLWLETDTNSVHLYSFGYYNQNIKQGEWFSIDKTFKVTKRIRFDQNDTLFCIDYVIGKSEYINRLTSRKETIDDVYSKGIGMWSSYDAKKNELFETYPGYYTGNSKSGFRISILYDELESIFFVNDERKIDGKMILFEKGNLTQILNFENGLIHGEVIYYKNNIVVNKLIYYYGVLIYPKKINKRSLVVGYFEKGNFYPYSNCPINITHLFSGSFGIAVSYTKKNKVYRFPEYKKIDNISKCNSCGVENIDYFFERFIKPNIDQGW